MKITVELGTRTSVLEVLILVYEPIVVGYLLIENMNT